MDPSKTAAHAIGFTRVGMLRGCRRMMPLVIGLIPFGLVSGIISQSRDLSFAENILMNATVFAGAAQILALGNWSHPAPVLGATAAAFVVNLRMALMGPVLAPWLDRLRGWRLWGSLFFLVDHGWALSIAEMRSGGTDAGFFLGCGLLMWVLWVVTSAAGFLLGDWLHPPPGHPLFFAALAAFVSLLVPMWRGAADLLPWATAALTAIALSRLLPGTYWHIVAGALAGSLAGAVHARLRSDGTVR